MPRTILTLESGDWRGTGSAACDKLTLFDSVGFENADFFRATRHESGFPERFYCQRLDMTDDPNDPRNLCDMLRRAR